MSEQRPVPRLAKGFRDTFASDVTARRAMIDRILRVYERFGYAPLETPAVEFVDVLGKHLPESDTPDGGIFAWRDDDENWTALRYDLTAPLSRVFAQYAERLPKPYRRYQVGPVWRLEKPGPGRYREFYQCDFDTVGSDSFAADAEVCAVLASCFEELGIAPGDYIIRVNNRKVLNGVLDSIGLPPGTQDTEDTEGTDSALADGGLSGTRLAVLRAIDKLDRLGTEGVRALLGKGRRDPSGDFTAGAGLEAEQIDRVLRYVETSFEDRSEVCAALRELVGDSPVGQEGVDELEGINTLLDAMGLGPDRVIFDPSCVRGLSYYTGPVYEAELTFEVEGDDGKQPFGSVAGGGRYDDLVKRFTGQRVPATGASIGVDRLLAALTQLGKIGGDGSGGPVVVTVLERDRLADYQRIAAELRDAGIPAELYLGTSGFRAQLKYADKRNSPVAVIMGSDEIERGEVTLKDLHMGKALSKQIKDHETWRKGQPAQVAVPRDQLVEKVREILGREILGRTNADEAS